MNKHANTLFEFLLDDEVRLLEAHGDVPSGSLGRILGKIPRTTGRRTYAVSFVDEKVRVLSLRYNEIVLADDFRASA